MYVWQHNPAGMAADIDIYTPGRITNLYTYLYTWRRQVTNNMKAWSGNSIHSFVVQLVLMIDSQNRHARMPIATLSSVRKSLALALTSPSRTLDDIILRYHEFP